MKQAALEQIAPLLDVLRANPALCEVRPTVVHLDGRDFVHFHDEPGGVVADVRLTRGIVRMRVSTGQEQAELLERIDVVFRHLTPEFVIGSAESASAVDVDRRGLGLLPNSRLHPTLGFASRG